MFRLRRFRPSRWRHASSAAGLAAALAIGSLAAACASGAAPTIPTLRTQGPNASPGSTVSPEQAMRAYVACMREAGIDMPDPLVQGDGQVTLQYPDNLDKRVFIGADEGCRHFLANAYPAPTEDPNAVAEQDALLAYARCMREHGVEIADPNGSPGSVIVNAGEGMNGPSASFQAADKACSVLLPGKPGASDAPSGTGAPPPVGSTAAPSGTGR